MCVCVCVHIHVCVCVQGGGMHAGNHGDGEVLRLIRGTHTQKVAGAVDWVCAQLSVRGEEARDQTMCWSAVRWRKKLMFAEYSLHILSVELKCKPSAGHLLPGLKQKSIMLLWSCHIYCNPCILHFLGFCLALANSYKELRASSLYLAHGRPLLVNRNKEKSATN